MTIAGQHSLEEAINLLETKNEEILATHKGYSIPGNKAKVDAKHPEFAEAWDAYRAQWQRYYVLERTKLGMMSKAAWLTPNAILPAESDYLSILDNVKQFSGFTRMIADSGVTFDVKVGQKPSTDVDLTIYQKADSTTKKIESVASASAPWLLGLGIVGGLAWFVNKHSK